MLRALIGELRAELLDDPGYLGWFSGVIRVSQGELRLLIAQGTDGAGDHWPVILQLAEEGRLSLEDPVGNHLPGWSATDPTEEEGTCSIERLLSHQWGLPTNVPLQDYPALADPIRRKEVREAFLNYARSPPMSFTPGTGYRDSNVGYPLAGLIVLQHDSGTFDDFSQPAAPLSVGAGSWGLLLFATPFSGRSPARETEANQRSSVPTSRAARGRATGIRTAGSSCPAGP